MIFILVSRLQDMLYYNVLQEAPSQNCFHYICKPQSGIKSVPIIDMMPDIMPYHPAFITGRHLYTQGGVRFGDKESPGVLLDTYDNIVTGIDHVKYVVYDQYCFSNYGTMLLSYLICNKCPVLLVKGTLAPEVEEFYSRITQIVEPDGIDEMRSMWDNMRAGELGNIAEGHRRHFQEASKSLPLMKNIEFSEERNDAIVSMPLDRHAVAMPAETYLDKQGHEVLRLSQSIDQPRVTVIVTMNGDVNGNVNVDRQRLELLHKYNINTSKYPRNLITYVYQEAGTSLRSYVERADTEIIIMMAADMMYMPHSMYAKVKLLEKHDAACTTSLYHYHVSQGKGELLSPQKYPAVGTVAFKKQFFLQYPDCQNLDQYFYDNRWNNICSFSCNFNCIAISLDPESKVSGTPILPRMLSSSAKEFIISKLIHAGVPSNTLSIAS